MKTQPIYENEFVYNNMVCVLILVYGFNFCVIIVFIIKLKIKKLLIVFYLNLVNK